MPDVDSTTRDHVVVWSSFTVSQGLRLHFYDPQLYSGNLPKHYAQNVLLFKKASEILTLKLAIFEMQYQSSNLATRFGE